MLVNYLIYIFIYKTLQAKERKSLRACYLTGSFLNKCNPLATFYSTKNSKTKFKMGTDDMDISGKVSRNEILRLFTFQREPLLDPHMDPFLTTFKSAV